MNRQTVRVLLLNELRMLLRDRRTVILAIALPVVMMPLIFYITKSINERRVQKLEAIVYQYAVTGTESGKLRSDIARAKAAQAEMPVAKKDSGVGLESFKFEEKSDVEDPALSLKDQKIHFYLEALTGEQADALLEKRSQEKKQNQSETEEQPEPPRKEILAPPQHLPGVPMVVIYYQGNRDASRSGYAKMRDLLTAGRQKGREALLRDQGFPADPAKVFTVDEINVASAGQVTGSYVGRGLTLFLMMLLLSGGSVVALDLIAGEKERGSLETLLTTAASRGEIVAAKQLTILLVALVITVLQVANILFLVTLRIFEMPKDFVIEAPPAAVATLLLLFLPVAALVSSILLMLSAYAKTYKEAQLYFFPVYILSWIPALAAVLPGVTLRSAIVVVPIANVSVAVREILVGKFDWPMLAVTFAIMVAAALWAVRVSARMLSQERLVTASEADAADLLGGAALFPKHVLRWYAILGVILFVVALNVPQLATLRRQLLFNELVLFLGGPLLMLWKYRLNVRDALALRPVKPAVWIAALFLIPSVNMVGVGVFRLANLVLPVPRQMLEQFGRQLAPPDMPMWQIVLFLALLPGICEEIGFRGTLLYGLHRRFRPVSLVLLVGLIFGLFHVALFRIIPTGFIGVVLTAIALITGSIFPGMLVHAGNNAFAFWAGSQDFPLADLDWPMYFAALAVFGLSFYILYRNRTPYPGLRD